MCKIEDFADGAKQQKEAQIVQQFSKISRQQV